MPHVLQSLSDATNHDVLQLALLAKAVLVALLGEDALWPEGHGKVGLLFMFAAICASLLLLAAEMLSAHALISGEGCHPSLPLMPGRMYLAIALLGMLPGA